MIRTRLLALMLALCATPALADITFNIEEPANDSTRSGIGLISGWAVSDVGIVSVEGFIDGVSIGLLPYGSGRSDVANVFPEIPDAVNSGFAMKWAYSLTGEGEKTLRVVVTEEGGGTAEKEVVFNVIRFSSEFIADAETVITSGAEIEGLEGGRILVTGAVIEEEVVDIELAWDTGAQQFLIDRITYAGGEPLKAPSAIAGSDFSVEPGSNVVVTGDGFDADGFVSSHFWSQVSGPSVVLDGPDQWTTRFTAPSEAGTIRLRLEVMDDDGLTASDDVLIEVVDSNVKPEAFAGPDLEVNVGEAVSITGSGTDTDGEIVSYRWQYVSGAAVSLSGSDSPTVQFTAPGSDGYTRLRLTVTDDDGATDYDEVRINFTDPNQAPTANAGDDFGVESGDPVTVTGGGSDPDGSIVSWSWIQVSGTTVSLSGADSNEVSFTAPDSATTIRLRLTVTDDGGKSDSDDVYITVTEKLPDSTTGAKLQSMLDAINAVRTTPTTCPNENNGLGQDYPAQPALIWSDSLATIAMQHSMDMAAKNYFSHDSADGTTFANRVWPYWSGGTIGENIAGATVNMSDEAVVDLWVNSADGHCWAIMHADFTHAGIGVGRDEESDGYPFHHFWTLDFGG